MWGIVSCQLSFFKRHFYIYWICCCGRSGSQKWVLGTLLRMYFINHGRSVPDLVFRGVWGFKDISSGIDAGFFRTWVDLKWSLSNPARCEAVLFFPSGGFALTSHGFQAVYEVEVAKVPKVEDRSPKWPKHGGKKRVPRGLGWIAAWFNSG